MPYLKLDESWKSRIVAALGTQESVDHDPGNEKRLESALENLRKQHLWGDIPDEKYQSERNAQVKQLKLSTRHSQPPQLPNLEKAAKLLDELPALWVHGGVTDAQREALVQEVFQGIAIDGKNFVSIEPKPVYLPLFATILTNQKLGYRALESSLSPP